MSWPTREALVGRRYFITMLAVENGRRDQWLGVKVGRNFLPEY